MPADNLVPCVGLNYRHHAEEANVSSSQAIFESRSPPPPKLRLTSPAQLQIPTYPVIFSKPPAAITGPFDDIHIHPETQAKLDYEGELTAVIGKDCKNVKASNALDYILGFTVGNDVSARDFQMPASVCGGQFGYAKSFDQFAPIGPAITATDVIGDVQQLKYTTKVNGEVRQKTSTNDMIWTVAQIIEHLSRGSTLRAGTCIMTGTPSGVGLFMDPPGFLKDGDVVEIEVEKIGALKNKIVFD